MLQFVFGVFCLFNKFYTNVVAFVSLFPSILAQRHRILLNSLTLYHRQISYLYVTASIIVHMTFVNDKHGYVLVHYKYN